MMKVMSPLRLWGSCLAALLVLAACDDNAYLPGDREEVLPGAPKIEAETAPLVSLPPAQTNADFPLRNSSKEAVHYAARAPVGALWRTQAGLGDGKRTRWSAAPVATNGVIYTLDGRSVVSAISASNGQVFWQTQAGSIVDVGSELIGGGLSFSDQLLFASTAFGSIKALDLKTGAHVWTQKLEAGANGSPTYHNGALYVVSADGAGWKLNAADGKIQWRVEGRAEISASFGGAAPAALGKYVVFVNSAGEIAAHFTQGGTNAWVGQISGGQTGQAISAVSDVVSAPVISGNAVYVANFSGVTAKYDLTTGDLLWVAPYGTAQQIAVIGGSVFLVDTQNQLVRLDATNGTTLWRQALRLYSASNVRKRKAIIVYHAPVLAAGRLWVTTSDGQILGFDPQTGMQTDASVIETGATTGALVLNGRLFTVNRSGQLVAFSAAP